MPSNSSHASALANEQHFLTGKIEATKSATVADLLQYSKGMDRILPEFRQSAIPDHLTRLNVSWIEGSEAIEILAETAIAAVQKRTTIAHTKPTQEILTRYSFEVERGKQ